MEETRSCVTKKEWTSLCINFHMKRKNYDDVSNDAISFADKTYDAVRHFSKDLSDSILNSICKDEEKLTVLKFYYYFPLALKRAIEASSLDFI